MTATLVYVSDSEPGIKRLRRGRGFSYIAPDGTSIARGAERARIEALAVPPAYEQVWICVRADGHLQATGRDTRARKQYRYHPDWSEAQSRTKFDQLADFGEALPRIRARIRRDLDTDPGTLSFALAAATYLIDRTALRVGHADYARENGSYGALTLRRRHLKITPERIELRFTAKGGKKVRRTVSDKRLQQLLGTINDLPGATLLTWVDDDGKAHPLSSHQLNDYLASAGGDDRFTAKTFRTWAGTLAAYECAEKGGATIKAIAAAASDQLHNTPTVARNSYIHPDVIALAGADPRSDAPVKKNGLYAAEQRLLGFLTA